MSEGAAVIKCYLAHSSAMTNKLINKGQQNKENLLKG
jgi:hypothetical protein